MVDGEQEVSRHFSFNELRELFALQENTECETHEKLKCKRCSQDGDFAQQLEKPDQNATTLSDLKDWWHCRKVKLDRANLPDEVLKKVWDRSQLTFCMHQQSHKSVRKTV